MFFLLRVETLTFLQLLADIKMKIKLVFILNTKLALSHVIILCIVPYNRQFSTNKKIKNKNKKL